MKRPCPVHPRRPGSASNRVPRSRAEAAVELVRVEFQRERLQRELDELARRTNQSTEELQRSTNRADRLLSRFDRSDEESQR